MNPLLPTLKTEHSSDICLEMEVLISIPLLLFSPQVRVISTSKAIGGEISTIHKTVLVSYSKPVLSGTEYFGFMGFISLPFHLLY
ncbi:MAG: hypothetical protein JXR34_11380 [Bacteroidales bacterium]|nr:hypothetical protein [Bacteroidales bacterium]